MLGNGMPIQAHDVRVTRKGADQHHQGAFGQMKVGDQAVHHPELKPWRDENLRVAAGLTRACPRFQGANRRGAHRHHFAATRLAGRNGLLGGLGHFVQFPVHGVLGDVFGFYRLESARTHMQGHAGTLHALGVQCGQQGLVKMQRRRGRSHRAWCPRKHGLVTARVFFGVGVLTRPRWAFDVRWQWHHAMLFHQGVRFVAQLQVKQLAVFIGPAAQQHGIKSAVAGTTGHGHLTADQRFFAHFHVRHHLVAGQHALNQQLEFAARSLLAKNTRLDDLGVVEDQQVARIEQAGQIAKNAVHRCRLRAIQQARAAALGGRVLCNQFGGKLKIKIAERERAGCKKHGGAGLDRPELWERA